MHLVVVRIPRRFLVLCLLLAGSALLLPHAADVVAVLGVRLFRTPVDVVIDPGHGGVDPGANDHDTVEKDITLGIALTMRDMLKRYGVSVGLTRDSDTDCSGWGQLRRGRHQADLNQRARIINTGSVGLSIHVNTSSDPRQRGAMVLYAANSDPGKALAEMVISELAMVTELNHKSPVPRSNLLVLTATNVPTVLVEIGFLSNPSDKANMKDEAFQTLLASAMARGVISYLDALTASENTSPN